jgi:predicted metal-dependent hydrolase
MMEGLPDIFRRPARRSNKSASSAVRERMVMVGDDEVPLTIRHHPRSRSISLRIDCAKRGLSVTMPHWVAEREALAFITSRTGWIKERLAALGPQIILGDGDDIGFRGENYRIHWSIENPRTPILSGEQLLVGGEKDLLAKRVERWLKAQAKTIFADDLHEYCTLASERTVPRIGLSNARRRWGSCSQSGWVRVQWRLIMAPDAVRRAVIAHEVAHLRHMDHSPRFYAWMDKIYEGDRRAADDWLKAHGNALHGLVFA